MTFLWTYAHLKGYTQFANYNIDLETIVPTRIAEYELSNYFVLYQGINSIQYIYKDPNYFNRLSSFLFSFFSTFIMDYFSFERASYLVKLE